MALEPCLARCRVVTSAPSNWLKDPMSVKGRCLTILGMTPLFVHVLLSLIGIFAGSVVLFEKFSAKRLDVWTTPSLVTTALTSVTGYFFPFHRILPSHILDGSLRQAVG